MLSLIRTIWNVFLHTFRRRVTIQYPEQKPYLAPRTEGALFSRGIRMAASDASPATSVRSSVRWTASRCRRRKMRTGAAIRSSSASIFRAASFVAIAKMPARHMPFNSRRISKCREYNRQNLVYEKEDLLIMGRASIPATTSGASRECRSAAKTRVRRRTKRHRWISAGCCHDDSMEFAFYIAGSCGRDFARSWRSHGW